MANAGPHRSRQYAARWIHWGIVLGFPHLLSAYGRSECDESNLVRADLLDVTQQTAVVALETSASAESQWWIGLYSVDNGARICSPLPLPGVAHVGSAAVSGENVWFTPRRDVDDYSSFTLSRWSWRDGEVVEWTKDRPSESLEAAPALVSAGDEALLSFCHFSAPTIEVYTVSDDGTTSFAFESLVPLYRDEKGVYFADRDGVYLRIGRQNKRIVSADLSDLAAGCKGNDCFFFSRHFIAVGDRYAYSRERNNEYLRTTIDSHGARTDVLDCHTAGVIKRLRQTSVLIGTVGSCCELYYSQRHIYEFDWQQQRITDLGAHANPTTAFGNWSRVIPWAMSYRGHGKEVFRFEPLSDNGSSVAPVHPSWPVSPSGGAAEDQAMRTPPAASAPSPSPARPGEEITVMLPGAVPLVLVRIPKGKFQMGSPVSEPCCDQDEGPLHTVSIAYDFYLGKYEVARQQWRAVMQQGGSKPALDDDLPAGGVSLHELVAQNQFPERLNRHIATTNQGPASFRLPSEAEWEYACRAGTTTRFYFGDSLDCDDNLADCAAGTMPGMRSDYMWFCGNSAGRAHPIGQKAPNAFGLYDMSGNLQEWCADVYRQSYARTPTDGRACMTDSIVHVLRGGSYDSAAGDTRSAFRYWDSPRGSQYSYGFRVCRGAGSFAP